MRAQEIKEVIAKWAAAFEGTNSQYICSLYTDDAVLLGTLSPFYRDTPELIKEYFDGLFQLKKRSVDITEIHVQEYSDTATCSGFYSIHWVSSGQQINLNARFTFVLVKQSAVWLIAHHHSSALPKNRISACSDD